MREYVQVQIDVRRKRLPELYLEIYSGGASLRKDACG